jgi:hypothetical protein
MKGSLAPPESVSDFTTSIGLFVLLRTIIDQRPITNGYVFRIGLLAGCISEVINIVGRLSEEAMRVLIVVFSHQGIHTINFVFAVTDQLPTILATGLLAFALLPAATALPRKIFVWRFAFVAAMTAAGSVLVGRFLIPAVVNLIGLNFSWDEPGKLAIETANGLILSTVAG